MNPLVTALSIIYGLGLLGFTIIAAAIWLSNRAKMSPYKRFGWGMGGILILFEVAGFITLTILGEPPDIISILIIDVIAFLRIAAFTVVGIHFAALLGYPSFPILMRRFGVPQMVDEVIDPPQMPNGELVVSDELVETGSESVEDLPTSIFNDERDQATAVLSEPVTITPEPRFVYVPDMSTGSIVGAGIAVAVIGIIYSVVLFWLTEPRISDLATQMLGEAPASAVEQPAVALLTIFVVLSFALAEELIFRLGIQNICAEKLGWTGDRYWLAIFVATILWTIGHIGVLDPDWVKMAQIFPMGLLLGWLYKKYGVEACIIAHMLLNVAMILPAEYLIVS